MDRILIDDSGISELLDYTNGGRQRKLVRLYFAHNMSVDDIAEDTGWNKALILSDILVLNKLIEKNINSKLCCECGGKFYTKSSHKCPKCKNKSRQENYERQKEIFRSKSSCPVSKKTKYKFKSLKVIEKERAKYNKEHNTCLSYGQYVELVGE